MLLSSNAREAKERNIKDALIKPAFDRVGQMEIMARNNFQD